MTYDDPFQRNWQGSPPDCAAVDRFIQEAFQELAPAWMEIQIDLYQCEKTHMTESAATAFLDAMGRYLFPVSEHLTQFGQETMPQPGATGVPCVSETVHLSQHVWSYSQEHAIVLPPLTHTEWMCSVCAPTFTLFQTSETSLLVGSLLVAEQALSLSVFLREMHPPYQLVAWCQEHFAARFVIAAVRFRGPHAGICLEERV